MSFNDCDINSNADPEQIRINNILLSIESKHPKNIETEKNLEEIHTKITNIYEKGLKESKEIYCKDQYNTLSKYAIIHENGIDIKPNTPSDLLTESLENFQNCFQEKNNELTKITQNLGKDSIYNEEELFSCMDRATLDSKTKETIEIENLLTVCFKNFEENYSKIAKNYNNQIDKLNI